MERREDTTRAGATVPCRWGLLALGLLPGLAACAPDEFTTDGPLEVRVELEDGIDAERVRIGLFSASGRAWVTRDAGAAWVETAELTFAPRTHSVTLRERFSDDVTVAVEPLDFDAVREGEQHNLEFPTSAPPSRTHFVIAWVDANDNGLLDLVDDADGNELAVVPRKTLDGRLHSIVDIHRRHPDNVRHLEGEFRVNAMHDGFDLLGVDLRDEDLGGWTATLQPR